jgi:hypothetical protein
MAYGLVASISAAAEARCSEVVIADGDDSLELGHVTMMLGVGLGVIKQIGSDG